MFQENISKYKFVHFFQDEKVVNGFVKNLEEISPNSNLFIVIKDYEDLRFVHLENNIYAVKENDPIIGKIIDNATQFSEIVFHSMTLEFCSIIRRIRNGRLSWVIWGGDLYEDLLYYKGYKLYIDEELMFTVRAQNIPVFFFKCLFYLRGYLRYRKYKRAVCSMSCVYTGVQDYDLLIKYFPKLYNIERKHFFYYPIETTVGEMLLDKVVKGKNIWVNNAAAFNGNHETIFDLINEIGYDGKVLVPLSYGDDRAKDNIISRGNEILGSRFCPLTSFVPKEEYYKLFLSCNAFIFGHLRQCAFGNILIALFLGAKVFLFKQNPLLKRLLDEGFILFSIEDELTTETIVTPMLELDREHNRKIALSLYSQSVLRGRLKNYFYGE